MSNVDSKINLDSTRPDDSTLAGHIQCYSNTLTPSHCAALIERFEVSSDKEVYQQDDGYSFTQVNITQSWPEESKLLAPIFTKFLGIYQLALNASFWPSQFAFENLRIKRYLPNGRDGFPLHVDVMNQGAARRFMSAFVYLNTPKGGETVFPSLQIKIAAETGKMLAFPPLWLFPHAGLPPESGPKYILHTYMCYPS